MIDTKTYHNKSNYINNNCVSIQHEDNFLLLGLLLPKSLNESVQYQSKLANKPKLMIRIINQFKYTTELEFNYLFNFGKSEQICIKLYHDAKVAEMVYCTNVHRFIRLLGPKIPPKIHMQTRYALNTFLHKWLHYLLKNGYRSELWNDLKIRI